MAQLGPSSLIHQMYKNTLLRDPEASLPPFSILFCHFSAVWAPEPYPQASLAVSLVQESNSIRVDTSRDSKGLPHRP